jgi:hypothetical protein
VNFDGRKTHRFGNGCRSGDGRRDRTQVRVGRLPRNRPGPVSGSHFVLERKLPDTHAVQCDVSEEGQVRETIAQIVSTARHGRSSPKLRPFGEEL